MKKFIMTVEMSVSETWIEDGFDLSKRGLEIFEEHIKQRLPYAYESEFKVKCKKVLSPSQQVINKLQGEPVK